MFDQNLHFTEKSFRYADVITIRCKDSSPASRTVDNQYVGEVSIKIDPVLEIVQRIS